MYLTINNIAIITGSEHIRLSVGRFINQNKIYFYFLQVLIIQRPLLPILVVIYKLDAFFHRALHHAVSSDD